MTTADLGVIINRSLKFHIHVSTCSKVVAAPRCRVSCGLGMLIKNR